MFKRERRSRAEARQRPSGKASAGQPGRMNATRSSAIFAVLAALLAGCGEGVVEVVDHPELHGTYVGQFLIQAYYAGGAARRTFVCGGPGIITIASTTHDRIEGNWTFGPNTAMGHPPGERTCGENWLGDGELGGEILADGAANLSFFYQGTDLISGAFGDEYLHGGPRNSWRAAIGHVDSLIVFPPAWDDAPFFYRGAYFIDFRGSR